jgi:O-antigen ligase
MTGEVKFVILFMISYILFIVLRSSRPWLALYWMLRYLEIPLVGWVTGVILSEAKDPRDSSPAVLQNSGVRMTVLKYLGVGVIFSVILGTAQMVLGRTTGWFWILGERSFTLATPGVATMAVLGREVLRPYATFGHPNALGGFLAAAIILIRKKEEACLPARQGRRKKAIRKQWKIFVTCLGILGVLLTGSRGAMAALVVGCGLWVVGRGVRKLGMLGGLGVLGILGIFGIFGGLGVSGGAGSPENERVILAEAGMRMFRENWLTGAGPGQFLVKLPEYLPRGFYKIQPVHNIFLLWLAEFGVAGFIWLIWLIWLIWRNKQVGRWLPVLVVILVTGMVDHYWLTAQQNRLLMGVILGMMAGDSKTIAQKTENNKQ